MFVPYNYLGNNEITIIAIFEKGSLNTKGRKKKKKHHADQFDVYPLLQLFAFLLT